MVSVDHELKEKNFKTGLSSEDIESTSLKKENIPDFETEMTKEKLERIFKMRVVSDYKIDNSNFKQNWSLTFEVENSSITADLTFAVQELFARLDLYFQERALIV